LYSASVNREIANRKQNFFFSNKNVLDVFHGFDFRCEKSSFLLICIISGYKIKGLNLFLRNNFIVLYQLILYFYQISDQLR